MYNTGENYMTNNFIANFIIFCRFNVMIFKQLWLPYAPLALHTDCADSLLFVQFSESEINRFVFALDMPLDSIHCDKLIIDRTTLLCIVKHRASTWL
jgi:hypothetical protein